MPFYEYVCAAGHRWDHQRPVAKRADPSYCPVDGAIGQRAYSVPVIHWPRALWTQWGDVHTRSPREMARDPNIERYDPTAPIDPIKVDPRAEIARAYKEAQAKA